MSANKSFLVLSLILLISSICTTTEALETGSFDYGNDNPDFRIGSRHEGIYTITSGIINADSNYPWVTVIDRDGTDGGHLTVQLDPNVFYECIVYPSPQGGGTGDVADLEPNDVFIVWDEDPNHGSLHNFEFTGDYIGETPPYVQVTGTDPTNWTVYRVLSNGTLIRTNNLYNELDAIHLVGPLLLEKIDDINDGDCVGPGDEITYTICYSYPDDLNLPVINDVSIVDHLSEEVEPNNPFDPNYNPDDHTYTWPIGTISPGDANCFTLTVEVKCPEPGSTITNYCEMTGDVIHNIRNIISYEQSPVCNWSVYAIYVDADAIGANDGTSWQNAHKYLQDALIDANNCPCENDVEIRVAEGMYKPDQNSVEHNGTGNRAATFQLISGAAIKGGYAGYGAENPDARDIKQYETILSGDIGVADVNTDNSYHVVTGSDTDETAGLNGFTVTGGYADGLYEYNYDRGGGMYNKSGSPTVTNCTFSGNLADYGGGMYNESGNPMVINCIFNENSAEYFGGGMYNFSSSSIITNCIFNENSAEYFGGGMYNESDSSTITNCTFVGNSAPGSMGPGGGGIYGDAIVVNCILWDNESGQIAGSGGSVTYSDIQGGWKGKGNINADPCFVDPNGPDGTPGTVDDNLRLSFGSPCIDVGNNLALPPDILDFDGDGNIHEWIPIDLDGLPRYIDDLCTDDPGNCIPVDMGVYEFRIVVFQKVDINDVDCADPNDEITYIIDCNYPDGPNCGDIYDVNIIDYLPNEVNYVVLSLPPGDYNEVTHIVTWNIGTLKPGDTKHIKLIVKVKEDIEPCSKIRNCCMAKSGEVVLNLSGACQVPPSVKNCEEVYECGWGLPYDFSGDCYVNFIDSNDIAHNWWRCMRYGYPPTTGGDASCEHPWLPSKYVCKSHYNVINVDLNGGPNDPIYSGKAAFAEAVDTNCVIGEWNGFYLGEGVLMTSPRCKDIGEPCTPGTYARAIFIADPNPTAHIPATGTGDLLGDGFQKKPGGDDPNLFIWGTMAYGGIYDVYILSGGGGTFILTDSNGTTHGPNTIPGGGAPPWVEGSNYVVFRDVWINTPASRDAGGPNPNYVAWGYLSDPNCAFLSYSNVINGIQFASVKRRIMNERGVPPNDPNFDAVGNTAAYWSEATPIYIGTTGKKQNVFAGDYGSAYETNGRGGESDYDGPDVNWTTGTVHNIDYGEVMDYDVFIDDISDGYYRVRFLVRCLHGPANFSIYIDNSSELGHMTVQVNDGVDPSLYYWSTDSTNLTCDPAPGYLYFNFFKGLHRFKIKANQACFELKGFQLHHMYTQNSFDMDLCSDVIAYGYGLAGDINEDCYVNFEDLKLFLEDWLNCNNPEDPNCIVF